MYIEICSCLNTVICILGYTKLRILLIKKSRVQPNANKTNF